MNVDKLTLSHPSKEIQSTITLTGSKSESNRALIIRELSNGTVKVENLSEAADTVGMQAALSAVKTADASTATTIDIGPAGTAMRFLSTFLQTQSGNFVLTGTQRMKERPIGLLVDALTAIGADISYIENEGFPPLRIKGPFTQSSNQVSIPGDISSQYISSLLLSAPSFPQGLQLNILGELTSRPYVTMTLNMLSECGISYEWTDNTIRIPAQEFAETTLYVEPDWSAASYWYAIVALSKAATIRLPGLRTSSLQGDIAIAEIMTHFGVHTTFEDEGILLQKTDITSEEKIFDFKECPDLAQTVVVVAAAQRRNVSFKGLETLKIKETDRIAALQTEIAKFGCQLIEENEVYHLRTDGFHLPQQLSFDTYEDHRMAMAFAPLALMFEQVNIIDPQVVEKSYPDYWKHLEQVGFQLSR